MNVPLRTWILLVLVLGAAVTTVLPSREPTLPGMLELAVLRGPGDLATSRALTPLADYLGLSLRRSIRVRVVAIDTLTNRTDFDLALLPARLAVTHPTSDILAWSKPRGTGAADTRPLMVYRSGTKLASIALPRVIVGDASTFDPAKVRGWLQAQGVDASSGAPAFGHNPYDHSEALAALVHRAFDLAVVRESDLRVALDSGLVDRTQYAYLAVAPSAQGFALVAGPDLPTAARRKLRDAALNLDHLRYDPSSLRARGVLEAMGNLGLDGFVPAEILPSLRP